MVARPTELLEALQAPNRTERLGAIKKVKNSIIGNKGRKGVYIQAGVIPRLITLLSDPQSQTDPELQVQLTATLGSLGHDGQGGVREILDHEGLQVVVDVLVKAEDTRVVEAAVRCIKMICGAGPLPPGPLLQPEVLSLLVTLLQPPQAPGVAEGAANILTACCRTPQEQHTVTEAGALTALLAHLPSWPAHSCAHALQLLAALLPNNPTATAWFLQAPLASMDHLTERLREGSGLSRVLAASCITSLAIGVAHSTAPNKLPPSSSAPAPGGSGSAAPGRSGSGGGTAAAAARVGQLPGRDHTGPGPGGVGGAGRAGAAAPQAPPNLDAIRHGGHLPLFRLNLRAHALAEEFGFGPAGAGVGAGSAGGAGASTVVSAVGLSHKRLDVAVGSGGSKRQLEAVEGGGGVDETMMPVEESPIEDLFERLSHAQHQSLPVVLRLLGDSVAGEVAVLTLALLVEENETLQRLAADADTVRHLCTMLCRPPQPPQPTQPTQPPPACAKGGASSGGLSCHAREGCLRALGHLVMSMGQEDYVRKCIADPKVLSQVQSALEDPSSAGVRAAAALCILALSRSIKSPRLGPEVTRALCRLLKDEDTNVQVNACAALCNLVLEFSSQLKVEVALDMGALEVLAAHTGSPLESLRLYSSWALRNLCHKSSGAIKRALMQAVGWARMRALLADPSEGVQEQGVSMLRNLCMDASDHITSAYEWGGADLLAALEEKLDPSRQVSAALRVHSLYVLVNSLTGSEATKESVMSSNLPALLLHHMRTSPNPEPSGASSTSPGWAPPLPPPASSTPTQPTPPSSAGTPASAAGAAAAAAAVAAGSAGPAAAAASGVESRLRRLRALGAQESLQALLVDPSLDVRERAQSALDLMRGTVTATLVHPDTLYV